MFFTIAKHQNMATQQWRYMMITVLVIITIFIYVIYITNEIQVPGRIHPSPAVSSSYAAVASELFGSGTEQIKNNSNTGNTTLYISNSNSSTKANNYVDISNSISRVVVTEEQSKDLGNSNVTASQQSINYSENTTSTNIKVTQEQKPLLPNKVENEKRSNQSNSTTTTTTSRTTTKQNNNNVTHAMPSPTISAAVQAVVSAGLAAQKAAIIGTPLDTTKGILTSELYEPGHLETSSEICPEMGGPVSLLILITTAPTHQEARLAIRQTWGHFGTRRDVSIAFMLGATGNVVIEDQLDSESYMYGDLIRGHFIDSYNNLTLKTISTLDWVDTYCPKAKFVLKTDDDMFINVPKLLAFIEKHSKDKRTIYGRLAKKWKPIRNKKSKYYVSTKQYFPAVFPQFTTGPAYLMTSDCIHDLYEKSLNQTYLKLEDVYTTGIVAHLVGIKRIQVNEFLNRRIAFNPCYIKKAISVHMVKSNEQFDLWKKLLDVTTKCK